MIVRMRTRMQAMRVAAATGGTHLPGEPKPDGTPRLSRYVDVGTDFEVHRSGVESVSVLFDLFDGDGVGYAATGMPGEPVPSGWMVCGAKFEVEWPTDPDRNRLIRSHFGARRKAFNWGLAQVKNDLDAAKTDPGHESVEWTTAALRKAWNRAKDQVAPCGHRIPRRPIRPVWLTWRAPWTTGMPARTKRKGRRVGFPKFKSARRDRGRVRFTTGMMRRKDDRRTIVVPVIGGLRSKENIRRVQRHLAAGRAQILNMTLSQRRDRLAKPKPRKGTPHE